MNVRMAEQGNLGFRIPSVTIDETEDGDFPRDDAELEVPRGSQFLGAAVWSYAPGQERRVGYFASPHPDKKQTWALLELSFDENFEAWIWNVSALIEGADDTVDAGRKLLAARWAWERKEWGFDRFDELIDFGCLDEADLEALASGRY